MKIKKVRVYIPVDIEMPEDHIDMVLNKDWSADFYKFSGLKAFALYAVRLMMLNLTGSKLAGTMCLTKFDGHFVDGDQGKFAIYIPEDDGWSIEEVEEWVET